MDGAAETDDRVNEYTPEIADLFFRFIERRDVIAEIAIKSWEEFCLKTEIEINHGHLLDVGCGSGRQTIHFAKNFSKVSAIDISAAQIAKAKEAYSDVTKIDFKIGRGERIPIPDCSVDVATSTFVAQELQLGEFLQECSRVLKPQGTVLLLGNIIIDAIPSERMRMPSQTVPTAAHLVKEMTAKNKRYAQEINHAEWHVFDRYEKIYEDIRGFTKCRYDEGKYDIEMTLSEIREHRHSIPFYRLPVAQRILEEFFHDLKQHWNLQEVSDDDVIVTATNQMFIITMAKM